MNNYHQIYTTKDNKTNYQQNNRKRIEVKHIQTKTVFYGTNSFPNAIIKNPFNGVPYLTQNGETMTVGRYGKHFFRVVSSNTNSRELNHLYYEDMSDYLNHHNVILTDANIARKWEAKKEYNERLLEKTITPNIHSVECSIAFTQPPWSVHV
jgi:hypothetical protein